MPGRTYRRIVSWPCVELTASNSERFINSSWIVELGSWPAEPTGSEENWLGKTNAERPVFGMVFTACAADLPLLFASHQLPIDSSDDAFLRARWACTH